MPRTKCPRDGCGKEPSFGMAGSRTAQFCAQHAEDGMVNVRGKRCEHPGCSTRPAFGLPFTKKVGAHGCMHALLCHQYVVDGAAFDLVNILHSVFPFVAPLFPWMPLPLSLHRLFWVSPGCRVSFVSCMSPRCLPPSQGDFDLDRFALFHVDSPLAYSADGRNHMKAHKLATSYSIFGLVCPCYPVFPPLPLSYLPVISPDKTRTFTEERSSPTKPSAACIFGPNASERPKNYKIFKTFDNSPPLPYTLTPSFASLFSILQVQFCRPHAMEGMVDVSTKSCGFHGCFKRPTFGYDGKGSKNGQFCAQHAQEGMVDVVSKRCMYEGCTTKRSFGIDGHRKNVRTLMSRSVVYCVTGVGVLGRGLFDGENMIGT